MYAALLTNMAWLDEELIPFQHLIVGLIDERVRVAQVVPVGVSSDDLSGFGDHIFWQESRIPFMNRYRVAALDDIFTGLGVDLIHAMDGRLWRGALKLADALNLPAVLSANSVMDIKLAQRLLPSLDPARFAVTAATEPLTKAIHEHAPEGMLMQTVGTGAHTHEAEPPTISSEQALCVIVSGNGVKDEYYESLLAGMAEFVQHHPATQFFFDGQGSTQHELWKAASALGLLSNISLIPRRLGHREMLLKSHALIHPQPLGRSRSLTLRAMARGLPVIVHHDPYLDYLIDGKTAAVLDDPAPQDWTNVLSRMVNQPHTAAELGRSARQWIKQNRPISHQVNGILDTYRRLTGQTLEFKPDA